MKNFVSRVLAAACILAALAAPGFTGSLLHAQDDAGRGPGRGGQGGPGGRMGGGFMNMGDSTFGTLTEVAADHLTLKTDDGISYKILLSDNTRVMKDRQAIKATELKTGDLIIAMGKTDEAAKTVGAFMVSTLDAERAKQMREMMASYGKTWLSGKITAINETKITISGRKDATYNIVVDENTSLRKRRDSITLADIKVGDTIRANGSLKGEVFTATELNVMDMPGRGGMMPPPPAGNQPQ